MMPGPVHGLARVALYWAPELRDPLHAVGSAWLGRDAETGATIAQPPAMAELTAAPRLYGLHATLKPPFRLAVSWGEMLDAARALAARTTCFALPPLAVAELDGFLALREAAPCPALGAFADACVAALDFARAPASSQEVARREAAGLTAAQAALQARWGYPYVFSEWRFHVTLSRRLSDAEMPALRAAAEAAVGAAAARDRVVRELCLFTQAGPGAPFLIAERLPLAN